MAADTQWPSEDEDFDATLDSKNAKVVATAERKSVPIVSDETPEDDSITAEAESPSTDTSEEPSSDKETPAEADEADTASEPAETAADEPEESAPEPQRAEPAAIVPPTHTRIPAVVSVKDKGSMIRLALEIVLVVAFIGVGLWAWTLSSDNNDLKQQVVKLNANPQIVIQKQTQQLISQVGRLIDLPKGETPTVANVSDAAAAKKQSAFFNNAQNGDKVLMYVKTGQAILYRPSTDKIVLVAPLTFSNTPAAPATTTTTKAKP